MVGFAPLFLAELDRPSTKYPVSLLARVQPTPDVCTWLTVHGLGLYVMKNSRGLTTRINSLRYAGIYFANNRKSDISMRHQRKTILKRDYRRLERQNISNLPPHIDSDWCWCDPIIEFNEDGQLLVIHKEVTWN
jgi:hypothetical protein